MYLLNTNLPETLALDNKEMSDVQGHINRCAAKTYNFIVNANDDDEFSDWMTAHTHGIFQVIGYQFVGSGSTTKNVQFEGAIAKYVVGFDNINDAILTKLRWGDL